MTEGRENDRGERRGEKGRERERGGERGSEWEESMFKG